MFHSISPVALPAPGLEAPPPLSLTTKEAPEYFPDTKIIGAELEQQTEREEPKPVKENKDQKHESNGMPRESIGATITS